jgi:hypothetical protein
MTADVGLWVIAVLQVGTAIGIATFWIGWFRSEHDEPWLPVGYVDHERVFVGADSVLSVVLVASAAFLVAGRPVGESLALIAAGMLAFLGILDLVYFAQQRMFSRRRGGIGNALIVGWVLLLAVILAVRFA